jgi:hypothetical protein
MGLEATCEVKYGRQASSGKARLEQKELLFKGDFRLKIPLTAARAEASKGALRVEWPEGVATFALGRDAEKWALKIRYPRGDEKRSDAISHARAAARLVFFITHLTGTSHSFEAFSQKKKSFDVLVQLISSDGR